MFHSQAKVQIKMNRLKFLQIFRQINKWINSYGKMEEKAHLHFKTSKYPAHFHPWIKSERDSSTTFYHTINIPRYITKVCTGNEVTQRKHHKSSYLDIIFEIVGWKEIGSVLLSSTLQKLLPIYKFRWKNCQKKRTSWTKTENRTDWRN